MSFAIPYCDSELLFSQMRDNKMKYEVQWTGYENHKKVTKKHGKFNTLQEAKQSVLDWWKQNNFEPPYVREIQDEQETIWDYGSHVCFYHFVRVDE